MKALITGLTVLMVGILLFTGCIGIPQEVQDELSQLRDESQQWEEVEKLNLEGQISDLNDQLAEVPHDPTYEELMAFMKEDKTDTDWYWLGAPDYVQVFLQNAREAGIQGHLVTIWIKARRSWFFAGFYCTDRKDWVFIVPAFDKEVRLEKGGKYHELNGFHFFGKYQEVLNDSPVYKTDDTIENIVIFD